MAPYVHYMQVLPRDIKVYILYLLCKSDPIAFRDLCIACDFDWLLFLGFVNSFRTHHGL